METPDITQAAQEALNQTLNSLRSEVSSLESQASHVSNENYDLDEKVRRLEQARSNIHEAKVEFNSAKRDTETEKDKNRVWKGKKCDDAENLLDFLIQIDEISSGDIDTLEDSLLAEINKYKNTITENDGLLDRIRKRINNLNYQIWQLVN